MPSRCDHEALGVLLGVCCASAQPCAAQRRLTLTGVNDFSVIHTPFPIRSGVMFLGFRPELYRKFRVGHIGTLAPPCPTRALHDLENHPFQKDPGRS